MILETVNLTHSFRKGHKDVDLLNLRVPTGSIYGFLGPNGAGKTTSLKLILGLLRRQRGEVFIFQKEFTGNRVSILEKTGSLIEYPSVYGHLTATENLLLLQKIYRCPKSRIMEVLKLVDLGKTNRKKLREFSLGMKQRMGIAIALLNAPSLLILDEPTNGLDPAGIIDMRELLLSLNRDHGITILVSSHLLSEIEKLVTHVGVINKGSLVFQGSMEELNAKQTEAAHVSFETANPQSAKEFLSHLMVESSIHDNKLLVKYESRAAVAEINRILVNQGFDVYEVKLVQNDLESIFMELTQQAV